jgi:hypothetical protein
VIAAIIEYYLASLRAVREGVSALSPDALLLVGAAAALLLFALFVAWRRETRHAGALVENKAALEEDIAALRDALENEIKWRLASDMADRQASASPVVAQGKSAKELFDLLGERFNAAPSTAKPADGEERSLREAAKP